MKTIGFVDYYISEWHANNYPNWIKQICDETGDDFCVKYAYAERYDSPVDGRNTDEWCAEFGVEKCDTIEELCEKADYILVLAPSNPEKHLNYAEKVLKAKKNTYIDKTFAPDYATAKKIFDIAKENGTAFFSSSALRYAPELNGIENCKSVITTGGGGNMPEYIIHQIEMVVKVLGAKAEKIKVDKQGEKQYIITVGFENDKQAVMIYAPNYGFALNAINAEGKNPNRVITSDFFKVLIADILRFYKTGETSFDIAQTLEAMKIRTGVIEGQEKLGEWIKF